MEEKTIPNLTKLITGLLKNDPRPGYKAGAKENDGRIYGMKLFDFDLKWTVEDQTVHVLSMDTHSAT